MLAGKKEKIMKKIILSLAMIAAMAALAVGATTAFFSDTETSSGNTFTAGAVDLTIDNECHYNGMVCALNDNDEYVWQEEDQGSSAMPELLGQPCDCTWNVDEWQDGRPLFKLDDLKPGDWGEYTVSFDIESNPVWACMYIDDVIDKDNTCTEPEQAVEGGDCSPNADGELDNYITATVWHDTDCDNVMDSGYEQSTARTVTLDEYNGQTVVPIADTSAYSLVNGPVNPGRNCVGISWNFDKNAGNDAQTDQLGVTLGFYVEQARHNDQFVCRPQ